MCAKKAKETRYRFQDRFRRARRQRKKEGWVSFLGLLGVLGGMDNETIGFVLGMIWAAIFMAAWIASLAAGGWLE